MTASLRLLALAIVVLTLGGCRWFPDASYRYKFALSIETPEGVKTGSTVVQLDYFKSWSGEPHRAYGQALVIDLGARGILAALLSQKAFLTQERRPEWRDADPSWLILNKCSTESLHTLGPIDTVRQIAGCTDPLGLNGGNLPDLILFRKATDPASAVVVDYRDPAATLGAGVKIRSATLQVTRESITKGVDEMLPWVRSWWGSINFPANFWTGNINNFAGHMDFIKEGEG